MNQDQEYDFKKIEKKWQDKWDSEKIFEASEDTEKKKFYCLEMFPYPSGQGLHIGHSLNYTIGDIFARFKKMSELNVLHPMGYDAFGLPAENAAISAGIHPKEYTQNAISNFIKQQKLLGLSYDWSRVLETCSPNYYKWNQYFFIKFFKKNLVYRKKAPVNWCPKCKTVLANEQVNNGKCWRHEDTEVEIKHLEQWFIRTTQYADELLEDIKKLDWPEKIKLMQKNWIGKSYGAEINFEINGKKYPVFTTRPDTIYGVTFLVISLQHEKLWEFVSEEQKSAVEEFFKKLKSVSKKSKDNLEILEKEGVFTGSYATHPLTKEKLPVYAANFVVADYGSGIVMAVPAHDQRDYEFAKKYKLPIKPVVLKQISGSYSFVMGIEEEMLKKIGVEILKKTEQGFQVRIPHDKIEKYKKLVKENLKPNFWNEFSTQKGFYFIFKHNDDKVEEFKLNDNTNDLIDKYAAIFNKEKREKPEDVYSWLSENELYRQLLIHSEKGRLINSNKFNGLDSETAKEKIIEYLTQKKIGKKSVQYKLKDWLISRQRYWGTPIPIIYCNKCGIVPVPEKELPVTLPEDVKFGEGNPLETKESFIKTKCPKCGGDAKRETDTMDTFFDSSWYFLRFADPKNNSIFFEKEKVDYWLPVDLYIGGAEHACMHLIYARFFTKVLRDFGLLKFGEPFKKLFNQGMLHANDGRKMSKSLGNVINPLDIIQKKGADSLRLALVSFASPDSNINWDEKILESSFKFLKKVYGKITKIKLGSSKPKTEHKLNKMIREVSEDIESMKYNIAVIKIKEFFKEMSEEESKETVEKFIKVLSPFCPHICEELWESLGNKGFVSISEWPKVDESKINEVFDRQEEVIKNLINDIKNILKIISEKGERKNRCFIYVLPNEKKVIEDDLDNIKTKTNFRNIKIFAVNDPKKYDPENKSRKVKPNKPGIYFE